MELPSDVHDFLATAFHPADRAQAVALLEGACIEDGSPASARLLRCAAFASGGRLERLRHWVKYLALDWRDVVVAGECEAQDGTPVHVRNFSKPMALSPPTRDDQR